MEQRISRKLIEVTTFGTNPGSLRSWLYLPTILAPNTPLVVVLHGCTQNAAGFDRGSGWTALAEEKGFAVLFPEQRRENNANLCFNWFEPTDTRRGSGEALSIQQMISHVVRSQRLDAEKVFITGLSAGGAMANVMLATYPEVFAAGAIIGGLPYGVASNVGQAFERMKGRNPPTTNALKSALPKRPPEAHRWPRISIWHGTHDQVVRPINAEQIAEQWAETHKVAERPSDGKPIGNHQHKAWLDANGNAAIEMHMIKGMGHGVPLSSGAKSPLGEIGPFMLESGISSTARIAKSWGLATDADVAAAEGAPKPSQGQVPDVEGLEAVIAKAISYAKTKVAAGHQEKGRSVGEVINDALRAAGLMR